MIVRFVLFFFFNDTATTEIYTSIDTLSLHDALPIYVVHRAAGRLDQVLDLRERLAGLAVHGAVAEHAALAVAGGHARDEDLVAVDAAVRPRAGRRLVQLGAAHALHLHRFTLLTSVVGRAVVHQPEPTARDAIDEP